MVSDDALAVLATPHEPGESALRHYIVRDEIQEIRIRQGVGGGFLEAIVDDVCVELLAFSNAKADIFHKVAGKLERWVRQGARRGRRPRRRRPAPLPQVRPDPAVQGRRLPPLRQPRGGLPPRAAS